MAYDESTEKWINENIIAPLMDEEGVHIYEWNYSGKMVPRDPALISRDRGALRRSRRIAAARAKGTHSKAEWSILAELFGQCVICSIPYEELYGGKPSKDHIVPIFAGGCDCIANIQPVCKNCNSAKTDMIDYRARARSDWARAFTARLENGWE